MHKNLLWHGQHRKSLIRGGSTTGSKRTILPTTPERKSKQKKFAALVAKQRDVAEKTYDALILECSEGDLASLAENDVSLFGRVFWRAERGIVPSGPSCANCTSSFSKTSKGSDNQSYLRTA